MVRDTGQRIPCFDRRKLTITWMSNIKNLRRKPELGISWSVAAMLCDVVVVVAASHIDHEKIVLWFSICSRACGSVSIVMGLCLATLHTARAPL